MAPLSDFPVFVRASSVWQQQQRQPTNQFFSAPPFFFLLKRRKEKKKTCMHARRDDLGERGRVADVAKGKDERVLVARHALSVGLLDVVSDNVRALHQQQQHSLLQRRCRHKRRRARGSGAACRGRRRERLQRTRGPPQEILGEVAHDVVLEDKPRLAHQHPPQQPDSGLKLPFDNGAKEVVKGFVFEFFLISCRALWGRGAGGVALTRC